MDHLRSVIYVAIRTAPANVRRRISAKLPIEGDAGANALTDRILEALAGYECTRRPNWGSTDAANVQTPAPAFEKPD